MNSIRSLECKKLCCTHITFEGNNLIVFLIFKPTITKFNCKAPLIVNIAIVASQNTAITALPIHMLLCDSNNNYVGDVII